MSPAVSLPLLLSSNRTEKGCYPELMSQRITNIPTVKEQCFTLKYRGNHDVDSPQKVLCAAHELFEKGELSTPLLARVGGPQLGEIDTRIGSHFRRSSASFAVETTLWASKKEGGVL